MVHVAEFRQDHIGSWARVKWFFTNVERPWVDVLVVEILWLLS